MNRIELADGLSLPLDSVTETFAILANRGSGKSVTAHRLVEQMHLAGLPVVVLDVKGDWWGIRSSADGKGPGLPFVIFGGDHGDVPLESTAGELLADLIVDDRVPAVLDMSSMSKTKARTFATAFAERLYQRNRDPLHVVIEEADVLIPQRASADTARLLGAMEDIAKRGRSRGLGLTLCTQRGQEVAKSVLELMETVVLLRMTGPRSIKAAQDWIRVSADTDVENRARDVISSLPELETGEAWVWSPAFLRILQRVRIHMFDTFDSHATPKPGQARVLPKGRADIDLEQLGAEIAATVQRALQHDPKALRANVEALRSQLAATTAREQTYAHKLADVEQLLADKDHAIAALHTQISELQDHRPPYPTAAVETLGAAARMIDDAVAALSQGQPPDHAATERPASPPPPPQPAAAPPTIDPLPPAPPHKEPVDHSGETPKFRAGALRMLQALGQMAPLRLTDSQWGMVAKMKHTGGTFSTYRSELLRAALIEKNHIGYTLTTGGFAYLGHRPKPMTGAQLQQHYLSILRKGEARMLQALIDAHPSALDRDELAAKADIAVTGGTFSTYLGVLRRNGLVEERGQGLAASAILIHGAASAASEKHVP